MANASKSKAGFRVPCPLCGAFEGLTVIVHDLTLKCVECDEAVTRDELQGMIDQASKLLTWLNVASTL